MSNSGPTNTPVTVADQIIHELIFSVAVKAAEAGIIAEAPYMAYPGLKQLDEAALNYLASKIYAVLSTGVNFTIIDAQTSKEAADAQSAAQALRTAIASGDQNAIKKNSDDFSSAFGRLVHLDGSA